MVDTIDKRQGIGNRISALRKIKGLTLQKLSTETNISIGYLSDSERGASALSGEKIALLARALCTSTDYLLSGVTPPSSSNTDEISIPRALSEAAVELGLTYDQTKRLLDGRQSLVARRSSNKEQDWDLEKWIIFYKTVKDYL